VTGFRLLIVAAAAVGLCLVTAAEAQQARRGPAAQNAAQRADAAQEARTQQMMNQQKAALAKAERDKQFAANLAAQQAQMDAIKSAATAENRPLSPEEETRIAAISQRMTRMTSTREAVVAAAEEKREEAREKAEDRRESAMRMREDRCRAAGVHVARIDRPKGRGC